MGSNPTLETMEARRTGNTRRSAKERRYHDRRADGERRQLPASSFVKKILVTGDREWDDIPRIVETLKGYRPGTVLVHGAYRGADTICAAVGEALGFNVRSYPPDWERYHKAAGPIRNQQMLDEEHKPDDQIDLCLAFHNHIEDSTGTADMLNRVKKTSIPWILNTSNPCSEPDVQTR